MGGKTGGMTGAPVLPGGTGTVGVVGVGTVGGI